MGVGGRIEVDWNVLLRAGQQMGSIGNQMGMLNSALSEALGSGIASGIDPAGLNFGIKYGRQAGDFADAMAKATDAFKTVGYMLEATGYNYQNSDAASTIGGGAPTGSVGAPPGKTTAGDAPKGPNGALVSPPAKWAIIQTFLGPLMAWPSGNSSMLHLTAAQWRNLANGMSAFDGEINGLKSGVAQQKIPEGGKIVQALSDLAEGAKSLSDAAKTMAQSIDDFAKGVQETQDAIRDLMDRLSLDGLVDTITGLFTGKADDILRDIAHDVSELIDNFQSQVKGVVGLLEELTVVLGDAADAFQKWIRPILVGAFGDDVGNALADYVTLTTDFQVGLLTGVINTVSGVVSLADADTWKGLAATAEAVLKDPSTLPGVLENMGKQFVAWDKWSGDHPGRAAGEAAFNIGSLFVPGGALAKGGSVAKGLSYASKLLEEGRLPRVADLPGLGGASRGLPGAESAGRGIPDVPEFHPGAVPDSVVSPSAPGGLDAPTSPASVGAAPSGTPSTAGGTGTGGGSPSGGTGSGGGSGPGGSPGAGHGSGSGSGSGGGASGGGASGGGSGTGSAPTGGHGSGEGSSTGGGSHSGSGSHSGDGSGHGSVPGEPATAPQHTSQPSTAGTGSAAGPTHAEGGAANGSGGPHAGGPHADSPHSPGHEPGTNAAGRAPAESAGGSHGGGGSGTGEGTGQPAGGQDAPGGAHEPGSGSSGGHHGEPSNSPDGSAHSPAEASSTVPDGDAGHHAPEPSHSVNGHEPAEPGHSLPQTTEAAERLNSAFGDGGVTPQLVAEVSDWATHHVEGADRVVLGKWDGQDGGYIGEARHNGGTYFDTGDEAWAALENGLSESDAKVLGWQVNEQFLRTQMENGVGRIEYVLPEGFDSVDQVARVRRESFSALEINFLNANASRFGYVRDGNSWVLKGHE